MAWTGRYATALIAGNRGDRQRCQEICQAMVEWATPRQLGHLHEFAHHALAQAALGAGDFEEGYANATAISPPGTLGSHTTQALWVALDLIDAAVHTGTHRRGARPRRRDATSGPRAPLAPVRPRHRRRRRDGRLRRRSTGSVSRGACTPGDRGVAVRARSSATRVRRTPASAAPDTGRPNPAHGGTSTASSGSVPTPWSQRAATELGGNRRHPPTHGRAGVRARSLRRSARSPSSRRPG